MIRVALRFDDPSPISHREVEEGVIAALAENDARATFAVIPFKDTPAGRLAVDANNGSHLLAAHRAGVVEIALHGHSHLHLSPGAKPSEFSGVSAERQASLLAEAAGHLRVVFGEGSLSGFVPPFNSYDASTLLAVEHLGFRYLSAGWKNPEGYHGGLSIMPPTCKFAQLESAIDEARRYARFAPIVIMVLHHYEFRENCGDGSTLDMAGFTDRLRWLKQQPDVEVMSLAAMAAAGSPAASARALGIQQTKAMLHWRLQKRLPSRCQVDAPIWRLLLA